MLGGEPTAPNTTYCMMESNPMNVENILAVVREVLSKPRVKQRSRFSFNPKPPANKKKKG
jgi:hypothetical protein